MGVGVAHDRTRRIARRSEEGPKSFFRGTSTVRTSRGQLAPQLKHATHPATGQVGTAAGCPAQRCSAFWFPAKTVELRSTARTRASGPRWLVAGVRYVMPSQFAGSSSLLL